MAAHTRVSTAGHTASTSMATRAIVAGCVILAIVSTISDELAARRRDEAFAGTPTSMVTIAQGDCLWSLAESHAVDGATTSEVVEWIAERNDLSSSELRVGALIEVPACAVRGA